MKTINRLLAIIFLAMHIAANSQEFSVVVLPDIQNMTWSPVDQNLYKEMQYIIDNKTKLNVQFVVSLGDYTAGGYGSTSSTASWDVAKKSSNMIVNAGIPYAVCMGNHDMDLVPQTTTPISIERFKQYYPTSETVGKSYFGGFYRDMSNGYYLFSASGMDFIILVLQNFQESPYDPAVAAWANGILDKYSNRRAIISTHMLNPGNEYMNNIITKHDNVFMAVYGHDCGDNGERHWTATTPSGNTIHCMMTDYQCRSTSGGGAILRWYTFKPTENKIFATTYDTYNKAYETDASSQFSFDYQMGTPTKPVVAAVSNNPLYPLSSETATISATITDDVSIASATINWGTASGALSQSVSMVMGTNNIYTGIIPANTDGTKIFYTVKGTDGDGNTTTSSEYTYTICNDRSCVSCPNNPTQKPYLGNAPTMPGKVEVENYNVGCMGVAYYDADAANQGKAYRSEEVDIETCTDAGGGYNVGYTSANEWLNYNVDVTQSGYYTFDFRVASAATTAGSFHIELNNINVSGKITAPITGGWQNWQTVSVKNIVLSKGIQNVKIVMETGGFNLNYFNTTLTAIITGFDEIKANKLINIYPNPFDNQFSVEVTNYQDGDSYEIVDITGKALLNEQIISNKTTIDMSGYSNGIYFVRVSIDKGVTTKKVMKR